MRLENYVFKVMSSSIHGSRFVEAESALRNGKDIGNGEK